MLQNLMIIINLKKSKAHIILEGKCSAAFLCLCQNFSSLGHTPRALSRSEKKKTAKERKKVVMRVGRWKKSEKILQGMRVNS